MELGPGHGRPEVDEWEEDVEPGPLLHTLTGFDPFGRPAEAEANAEAHRRLVAQAEERGWDWEPVVGASPDAAHHELGIVTSGLTRAEAIAVGVDYDQLAIFEIDDEQVLLVPCDGGDARPLEDRWGLSTGDITYDHVIAWRDEHEEITGTALPRTRCPQCGAADPRPIMYGMPAGIPPDWVALGGCIISPGNPRFRCRVCGGPSDRQRLFDLLDDLDEPDEPRSGDW